MILIPSPRFYAFFSFFYLKNSEKYFDIAKITKRIKLNDFLITMNNLNNSEYQINDLFFHNNKGFPEEMLIKAIEHKVASTEMFLKHLEDVYIHHVDFAQVEDFYGLIHASFILGQFREKRAFPLIIQLLKLPLKILCSLYGDFLLNIPSLLASVYNDNFESIAYFIENRNIDSTLRSKALRSLCILVNENLLERTLVINYLKSIIKSFSKIISHENKLIWFEALMASVYLNATDIEIEIKKVIYDNKHNLKRSGFSEKEIKKLLFNTPSEIFNFKFDNLKLITNVIEELRQCTQLYEFRIKDPNSPLSRVLFYTNHNPNKDETDFLLPTIEISDAIQNKEIITDILLQHLDYAYLNRKQLMLDENYCGLNYTSYILAQLREERAFPLFLKLCSLPIEVLTKLYGGTMTKSMHQLLASTYNGDFESLARLLIENPKANNIARAAGLRCLVVLILTEMIDPVFFIHYIRNLFNGQVGKNDYLQFVLVDICSLLNIQELMPEIQRYFNLEPLNHNLIKTNKKSIDVDLNKTSLKEQNKLPKFTLILDAIKELENLLYNNTKNLYNNSNDKNYDNENNN